MNNVKDLTDETFADAIATGVTLVDFWAPWCGPCKPQGEIVKELADQVGEEATIAKLNVDDAPAVAGRFAIRAIPTVIVFKDGAPVQQFVGVTMGTELHTAIRKAQQQSGKS